MPQKTEFLHLSIRQNLLEGYPLFFNGTQPSPSFTLNIRPSMEYASHVWGGSTHTALLNRVESKAFRLINSSSLTDCLQPLSHRPDVASLAIFYRYFHANCSSDLANCIPPTASLHKTCLFLSPLFCPPL